MDRSVRVPGSGSEEYREVAGIAAVAVGVPALVETLGAGLWAAPLYGGPEQSVPFHNPAGLAWQLFSTHELVWSAAACGGLATVVGGSLAGVAGSVVAARWACGRCRDAWQSRRRGRRSGRPAHVALGRRTEHPVDDRARYMARGRELEDLCWEATVAKAERLGVALAAGQIPGVLIGRTVLDNRELFGSYEDLHLDIWGPRTGKSTSRVIPAVMDAPGAVVATSNKRDVVDATRDHRADVGGDVWVFDPQGVAAEEPSWYWDPCAWVLGEEGGGPAAQERAAELAGHFASGHDDSARGGDAFFEPEGEELVTGLILAAALAKEPITKVFEWITHPDDRESIAILDKHGFELMAGALSDQYYAAEKQRSGVFSTAKKQVSCLKYTRIHPWIRPPAKGERPRRAFDVNDFVTSRDTLYPLSKEGKGSAGPLVTALCAAVAAAGEREGTRHGGRMPVPMLIVLDEAANIVRWRDLPKQYSHFGSRGIVVMTILQSWAQGQRCWGPEGMTALWSAANIKVLGAGLDDTAFLRDRSESIGDHYELSRSVSASKGHHSTSTSRATERTVTTSDLTALPKGRCVVFTSGHRPTLVRTVPWMERGDADVIRASLAAHDPATTTEAGGPRLRAVPPVTDEEDAA